MDLGQASGSLLKDRGYGAEASPSQLVLLPGLGAPGRQGLLWFECKMPSTGCVLGLVVLSGQSADLLGDVAPR